MIISYNAVSSLYIQVLAWALHKRNPGSMLVKSVNPKYMHATVDGMALVEYCDLEDVELEQSGFEFSDILNEYFKGFEFCQTSQYRIEQFYGMLGFDFLNVEGFDDMVSGWDEEFEFHLAIRGKEYLAEIEDSMSGRWTKCIFKCTTAIVKGPDGEEYVAGLYFLDETKQTAGLIQKISTVCWKTGFKMLIIMIPKTQDSLPRDYDSAMFFSTPELKRKFPYGHDRGDFILIDSSTLGEDMAMDMLSHMALMGIESEEEKQARKEENARKKKEAALDELQRKLAWKKDPEAKALWEQAEAARVAEWEAKIAEDDRILAEEREIERIETLAREEAEEAQWLADEAIRLEEEARLALEPPQELDSVDMVLE